MITFVTSMSCNCDVILRHANSIYGLIYHVPAHMNQKQEVELAESVFQSHKMETWKNILVPCFYELTLLRLLRKVREGELHHEELVVHCLNGDGSVQIMKLDSTGEFVDRFKEGFFEGRSEELF